MEDLSFSSLSFPILYLKVSLQISINILIIFIVKTDGGNFSKNKAKLEKK